MKTENTTPVNEAEERILEILCDLANGLEAQHSALSIKSTSCFDWMNHLGIQPESNGSRLTARQDPTNAVKMLTVQISNH